MPRLYAQVIPILGWRWGFWRWGSRCCTGRGVGSAGEAAHEE